MPDKVKNKGKESLENAKKEMEKALKKGAPPAAQMRDGMHMNHSPAEMSPYKMGHSPAEMGHSPMENQNKGYAKQERKDLMQDMPIVKDAMGGRDMSWMSKHVTKVGGSPIKSHCTK